MYLPADASRARIREAENARRNRWEIMAALSHGQVSRRELIKLGLFTAAGTIILKNGLSPFAGSALADSNIPTGLPASPLFGVKPFTQPMPRFDNLPKKPITALSPLPTAESNQTLQLLNPALEGVKPGDKGPVEGRPPGPIWAHQGFADFPPNFAFEINEDVAQTNYTYNPDVPSSLNSGINPATPIPLKFHPGLPTQNPNNVWTFNGTIPPKLACICYGDSALMRIHNKLPFDVKQNAGFGRHTTSTHKHNAHHGAENDGFTGAYQFPGQFYDYHWPIVLAGFRTINKDATDKRAAGFPEGFTTGDPKNVPGDFCETMSTHWFHDHMFSFTSQNVYKGLAGMINLYSAIDRGNEGVVDGVNLCLPSGTSKAFGNLDYDVNLMLADKAWDKDGQMTMDIFDFDGFLGDQVTVNLAYKPFFEVERRKYRFRILNGAVSRFFKIAFTDANGSPKFMTQIANDGNLLPNVVKNLTQLDEIGIAERYDIVIDFTQFRVGDKAYFVNTAEHSDGRRPADFLSVADAVSGKSSDPGVGKFLEFRIVREPATPDKSQVPDQLIPNPDLSHIPVSRERTFEFGNGGKMTTRDPITAFNGPWGVKTDGGDMLNADYGRVSAAPRLGTREIWTLQNGGGGWDHPIHIHFEEGQILARNGSAANVPAWERGRKDVYRLRPSGSVTLTMQFRDWGGMFMEHCHNTVHEDNAMLMRWEIDDGGTPFLRPLPTPIPTPQGVGFRPPDDVLRTAL
jgi:FtsP/CotA-like multicopper oxidase with cupredoxin domain